MSKRDMESVALATLPRALPDGPKSKWVETVRYLFDPVGMIVKLAERYGDPVTVPTLVRPLVITGAPDGIRAIFSADPDIYEPFSVEASVPLLGRGSLLLQSGSPHRRARKLMQPPFHGQRMRAYGGVMRDAARARLGAMPIGKRVRSEDVFRDISLDVIIRTIFGVSDQARVAETKRDVLQFVGAFSPLVATFAFLRREFGGFGPWARFVRLRGRVHQFLRDEIAARRQAPPGDDVMSMLVAARDESGAPMDEQEIVEQLFTMVIAGHETTATALAWAVDELWREPALLKRAREEARDIDGAGDPEKLAASALLEAICNETLRLHPLVPIVGRNCKQPLDLAGAPIPAGVGVGASILLAHRRESVYPEPHAFRPERFIGRTYSPYEFLPWGGGARRCLGAAFAFYEMKIVLGTLLATFEIENAGPRARTGVRPATIGPKNGVPIIRRA
jgi:cytochrome P450